MFSPEIYNRVSGVLHGLDSPSCLTPKHMFSILTRWIMDIETANVLDMLNHHLTHHNLPKSWLNFINLAWNIHRIFMEVNGHYGKRVILIMKILRPVKPMIIFNSLNSPNGDAMNMLLCQCGSYRPMQVKDSLFFIRTIYIVWWQSLSAYVYIRSNIFGCKSLVHYYIWLLFACGMTGMTGMTN